MKITAAEPHTDHPLNEQWGPHLYTSRTEQTAQLSSDGSLHTLPASALPGSYLLDSCASRWAAARRRCRAGSRCSDEVPVPPCSADSVLRSWPSAAVAFPVLVYLRAAAADATVNPTGPGGGESLLPLGRFVLCALLRITVSVCRCVCGTLLVCAVLSRAVQYRSGQEPDWIKKNTHTQRHNTPSRPTTLQQDPPFTVILWRAIHAPPERTNRTCLTVLMCETRQHVCCTTRAYFSRFVQFGAIIIHLSEKAEICQSFCWWRWSRL